MRTRIALRRKQFTCVGRDDASAFDAGPMTGGSPFESKGGATESSAQRSHLAQSDSAAQARGTGGKPRFKPGPYKREERPEKTAPRVDGKAASRPAARRSESD